MKFTTYKLCLSVGFALALAAAHVSSAQEQTAQNAQTSGTQEHNNVRAAAKWKRFDYTCAGDTKLVVYLHDGSAKVYYQDHLYLMRQTSAAEGARYSDGRVVWWSKGDDGSLQEEENQAGGEGQKIARDCYRLASPSEAASSATVTGTLTYLARIALPPQAVVQVQLLDISREQAESAPGALVAEQKFPLGQHGVPVPFTLQVDTAKVDAKRLYGVSARISLLGQVRFANREPYKVLTQGNPTKVDLVLLPAKP